MPGTGPPCCPGAPQGICPGTEPSACCPAPPGPQCGCPGGPAGAGALGCGPVRPAAAASESGALAQGFSSGSATSAAPPMDPGARHAALTRYRRSPGYPFRNCPDLGRALRPWVQLRRNGSRREPGPGAQWRNIRVSAGLPTRCARNLTRYGRSRRHPLATTLRPVLGDLRHRSRAPRAGRVRIRIGVLRNRAGNLLDRAGAVWTGAGRLRNLVGCLRHRGGTLRARAGDLG